MPETEITSTGNCVSLHGSLVSEAPHGGTKDSGFGSDLSAFSMERYTQVKHVMIRAL